MKAIYKAAAVVFVVTILANVIGVFFFFQPIARGDTSVIAVHPVIGLLAYVSVCTGIYLWAFRLTASSLRAAVVLIAPQAALILDLTLRGDRGIATGLAGLALLAGTWALVAYVHSFVVRNTAAEMSEQRATVEPPGNRAV